MGGLSSRRGRPASSAACTHATAEGELGKAARRGVRPAGAQNTQGIGPSSPVCCGRGACGALQAQASAALRGGVRRRPRRRQRPPRQAARASIARRRRRGHAHIAGKKGRAGGCATDNQHAARHTWQKTATHTAGPVAWRAHAVAAPPRVEQGRVGVGGNKARVADGSAQPYKPMLGFVCIPAPHARPELGDQEVLVLQRGCTPGFCRDWRRRLLSSRWMW